MFGYLKNVQDVVQLCVELFFGCFYYDGKWVLQDLCKVEWYLFKVVVSEFQVNYYLGQIYCCGFFGKVYLQKVVDYLIFVVCVGQVSVDMVLVQFWLQGCGIQLNWVNVYVFGQFVVQQQVLQVSDLFGQIEV